MRVMALDIGEKRIGVAVSDASGTIASPLVVIDAAKLRADQRLLSALVEDYEVELLIVGLPLSLDGTEGPQAGRVRRQADRLAQFLPIPVEFADERFSSAEATRSLHEQGLDERQMRGRKDMIAAAVFLQTWLDEHAAGE